MSLNCMIVDDEPLALDVLENYIGRYPGLKLLRACNGPIAALECLQKVEVDLMFLDIRMPRITGIQLLETLPNPPMVIFTTAHRKYALDGFNLNVVDFLLKPISFERFTVAANKAFLQRNMRPSEEHVSPEMNTEVFIRSGVKMIRVSVTDLLYAEGMKDYVKLHTKSNEVIVVKKTMKDLEQQLAKFNFIRVHRSFLVSSDQVSVVTSSIIRVENHDVPIGRNYREYVKTHFGQSLI